jgi:crotonobetainyl-CoA hydratase
MHENYEMAQRMLASADAIEGPRAFAEKHKPNWTGR